LSYNCPPNSLWSCLWSCLRWSSLSHTQQRVWTFFIANASCWHQCKNSDLKIIFFLYKLNLWMNDDRKLKLFYLSLETPSFYLLALPTKARILCLESV
jgi:hypothetical protein